MTNPIVAGRIVRAETPEGREWPAIIIAAEGEVLTLGVFTAGGYMTETEVPHVEPGTPKAGAGWTWHWPPPPPNAAR